MLSIRSKNITSDIQQQELVNMLLRTAFFMIFAAIVFVVFMYLHNRWLQAKKNTESRLSSIFQDLLIQYVNTEANEFAKSDHLLERIHSLIQDDIHKRIFRANIIELHKLFAGDVKKKIEVLYCLLGLHLDTIEMLNHSSWVTKIIALNELKEMNLERSRECVRKLTIDKNMRVSLLAMQTLMHMDNTPFLFLADHPYPLTQAQSIFIAKKVSTMKDIRAHELLIMFRHQDASINKLGMQIAQLANMNDSAKYIIPFLKHHETDLRIQAFISLSCLNALIAYRELFEFCNEADAHTLERILKRMDAEYQKVSEPLLTMVRSSLAMK